MPDFSLIIQIPSIKYLFVFYAEGLVQEEHIQVVAESKQLIKKHVESSKKLLDKNKQFHFVSHF